MNRLFEVDWGGVFVPTYSILEIFIRGTLTYLALFAIMRLLLRRQTGGLGVADILVVVLIADAAANALGKEYESVTEGVLLVATIVGWDYALDWLEYRFPKLRALTRPRPVVLVRSGRVLHHALEREMMTEDELEAELRKSGHKEATGIAEARMEGDGTVSVIKEDGSGTQRPGGKKKRPPA